MAKKEFQAESKKLMDMMINSIYTNKEIFLRELISNASDAIDKLYYKSLTDTSVGMNKGDFRILITRDKENRILTVEDNGIGMTKEELEQNLGTIAHSGSLDFKKDNKDENIDIIGQFGVGFYSAFMVADKLTVISKAKANIKKNFGIDIKEEEIPFDDPEIFKLMGSGHTAGVFQVESAGMTATIKNMKPTEYKHVVALIALYRPGPLGAGMVSSYINRMNGKEPAVSYDDRLDDILGETYGTMVYQEQVMLISVEMCGFSKGESDSRIRKPVAKKKIKLLTSTVLHWEDGSDETTYDHWMNGAIKNNYTREVAQKIWDDVLEFASYAFNKSHSAGYAILVMQTAWLKAHYPHEYMAAVLTSYTGKTDKIVHYVSACRHDGIPVLSPDVNESGTEFTATKEGVRFGLAGIRGVGTGVAQAIIAEREAGGPFKTLHDFVERVDSSQANRRVIESLIKAGAFDSTGYPRRHVW